MNNEAQVVNPSECWGAYKIASGAWSYFRATPETIQAWRNYCVWLSMCRPDYPDPTTTDYIDFLKRFDYIKDT